MASTPWQHLLASAERFRTARRFPIAAYSEFMPPPRLARKPYGTEVPGPFSADDPTAGRFPNTKRPSSCGRARAPRRGVAPGDGASRPWPAGPRHLAGASWKESVLAARVSRTGRHAGARTVRGLVAAGAGANARRQGPRAMDALWRQRARARPGVLARILDRPGARTARRCGRANSSAVCSVLSTAAQLAGPMTCTAPAFGSCRAAAIPRSPTRRRALAVVDDRLSFCGRRSGCGRTKYLLTFRPFGQLPKNVRRAYLAGDLQLLPFPGCSCSGAQPVSCSCATNCPWPCRFPCSHLFPRRENPFRPAGAAGGLDARAASRPSRPRSRQRPAPQHVPRARIAGAASIATRTSWPLPTAKTAWPTCSSATLPDDLGLYDKPMARNAQVWTHDFACCWTVPGQTSETLWRGPPRAPRRGAIRLPLPVSGHARRTVRTLLASPAGCLPGPERRRRRSSRTGRSAI